MILAIDLLIEHTLCRLYIHINGSSIILLSIWSPPDGIMLPQTTQSLHSLLQLQISFWRGFCLLQGSDLATQLCEREGKGVSAAERE